MYSGAVGRQDVAMALLQHVLSLTHSATVVPLELTRNNSARGDASTPAHGRAAAHDVEA